MDNLPDYERLGSFYLGRKYELVGNRLMPDRILYDAKDLTTHMLCVGMTGSGKTGLCLSLLEEAGIDGIPAICLDPKGDLGNLLLTFPNLAAADFLPWLEASEAQRKGLSLEEYAAETAAKWQAGLESWDQDGDRIRRFRDNVDIAIYTPGSNAGIPLTVLKSFDAPPASVMDDADVYRERITGAASGLLTLLGMEADPLTSREHILLANIFDNAWRKGLNLDLPTLIRSIQNPSVQKIGVFDLESFFPASDRLRLSMSLNNLLASPSFSGWLEGQTLDMRSLMYTPQGKPRISIISIAHLSDSERMFFVTILLNELLGWMRMQPGTSSLRALFYMDEVFGYFPPTAKPPSKSPMLVLLKQARAFGLGICLATQNPVDLDYKGLSNIGTWFLGRLQTQRDKDRVLDGLEGAAAQTGTRFDRAAMEQTLAALGNRVFLMNNVHDDFPTIFQSRWALSYLRGPLSRQQIQSLMDPRRAELAPPNNPSSASPTPMSGAKVQSLPKSQDRPIVPNDVTERFWVPAKTPAANSSLVYRPSLLANVSCHYVRASLQIDDWLDFSLIHPVKKDLPGDVWSHAREVPAGKLELSQQAEAEYSFHDLPAEMLNDKQYKIWEQDLRDYMYRHVPLQLFHCRELETVSRPGQEELDARLDWKQQAREKRDQEKEKLVAKYASKLKALESKVRSAEQKIQREESQYEKEKWNSVLSIGNSILGALVGKRLSARSTSAGRSIGRAAQERSDVRLAKDSLEDLLAEKAALDQECEREIRGLQDRYCVEALTVDTVDVPCRKGDMNIKLLALLWIPWEVDSQGIASPLVDLKIGS